MLRNQISIPQALQEFEQLRLESDFADQWVDLEGYCADGDEYDSADHRCQRVWDQA